MGEKGNEEKAEEDSDVVLLPSPIGEGNSESSTSDVDVDALLEDIDALLERPPANDSVKWAPRDHIGKSPSAVRVSDGYRGTPYDRSRPIVKEPNSSTKGEQLRAPLAYGPFQ